MERKYPVLWEDTLYPIKVPIILYLKEAKSGLTNRLLQSVASSVSTL